MVPCPRKKPAAQDDAKTADKKDEKKEDKAVTPDEEKKIAIERENKRKQDEYDAAIKKGQDASRSSTSASPIGTSSSRMTFTRKFTSAVPTS